MKTAKTIIFFLTFLFYFTANAQTEQMDLSIPKFQADILVLRTLESSNNIATTLTISDGGEVLYTVPLERTKVKVDIANTKSLAIAMNQLKKQGYKLNSFSSAGSGAADILFISTYIFHRE